MQKKMILKSDMRVYFDMDGTIAKWRDVPMEESRKPGYYTDLEPETELLDFLSAALKADKNMNILSSYYTDTRALLEKKKWLDKYLPGISSSHCLFVPYGKNKAEFVETMLLSCINHQSLIATKANRIVRAAQGRGVMEFGSRRAQGFDGAVYGARAAFIGGCVGTACTICERDFGIPALGTMAHSWIQLFDSELEAFCAYAREYPDNCTLLVDTYDTLHSGLPHAIEAFRRELLPRGCRPKGVRIDSGDITYLSKRMRKMLDEAGFPDCSIVASNSLDEYIIRDMLIQGAKVDSFGVGERLITAASDPVFGGVYKLSAIETEDGVIPKIKLSENVSKITTPGAKTVWRLFDRDSGKAIADVVTLMDEVIDERAPYELFDPEFTWKRKTVQNFLARPLLRKIFEHGKCICHTPSVEKIRAYCAEQVDTLWEEVLRFENPHQYYVDLSQRLWDLKHSLIEEHRINSEG